MTINSHHSNIALHVCIMSFAPFVSVAQESPATPKTKPAEELRMSTAVFREALRKRGLTELLELHLKDFPPSSATTQGLMMRDLKLAEYADTQRTPAERRAALKEANQFVEKVIELDKEDPRRLEWRFTLAHSRLYQEADASLTNILFRGGSSDDRQRAMEITTPVVASLQLLTTDLKTEYARMDDLSVREFEALERGGFVETLDRLMPQSDFLLAWALFYNSVPRGENDSIKARQLREALQIISRNPDWTGTSQTASGIQVQSLLLAGMAARLLHEHASARDYLDRALSAMDRMADGSEKDAIYWARNLAWLERIRSDRDDIRFDSALKNLGRFRGSIAENKGDSFVLELVAALLERTIYQTRAADVGKKGLSDECRRLKDQGWRSLFDLTVRFPQRRHEIYAAVYELLGPTANPESFDPVDYAASVAGLISDAEANPLDAAERYDRAVFVGERFLASSNNNPPSVAAEILFNTAVAHHRRERSGEAVLRFLQVVNQYPGFGEAERSALFAVQLAFGMYSCAGAGPTTEIRGVYREALETLLTHYPDSDAAKYWRFFHAQLLEELGEFDLAATQYAAVNNDQEHFVRAALFQLRSLLRALERESQNPNPDLVALRQRVHDFQDVYRSGVARIQAATARETATQGLNELHRLELEARMLAAEAFVIPQVGRAEQALETLAGLEKESPLDAAIIGRLWRVRLRAYERLDRLEEAAVAIPTYQAADRIGAGPTLQMLYTEMTADIERLRGSGNEDTAQRKAEIALLLARQIKDWAVRNPGLAERTDPNALNLQLAEAFLQAGKWAEARELFEIGLRGESSRSVESSTPSARAVFGFAESLFQMGSFAEALPHFNRLASGLPPANPMHWRALLRDLQCRTSLNHPPKDILRVLQQQSFLHPDFGGPPMAEQFEKLRRENERRSDGGKE